MSNFYRVYCLFFLLALFVATEGLAQSVSNSRSSAIGLAKKGKKGLLPKPSAAVNPIQNPGLSSVPGQFIFAASIGTFSTISGTGTVAPALITGTPDADNGIANNIPLGFTFTYDGKAYTQVAASVNGWLSFNAATTSIATGYNQPLNLQTDDGERPYLAPLFADLQISGNIYYQTIGSAPNRTFTVEWKSLADFNFPTDNAVSFQVILSEATGTIKFVYTPGPDSSDGTFGNPNTSGSGIAVGLVDNGGKFISVSALNNSATVSSTSEADEMGAPPHAGLTFTFTPKPHGSVEVPTSITQNSATFNGLVYPLGSSTTGWFLKGTTRGVYTDSVVMSPTPVTGSTVTSVSASVTGLSAGTKYYYTIATMGAGYYFRAAVDSFTTAFTNAGRALQFDGSNDYVSAPVLTTSTTNLTLEAWVKWSGGATASEAIFYNGNSNSTGYGIFLDHVHSDEVSIVLGGGLTLNSSFTLPVGQWTHVAATCDGSNNWTIYVNGVQQSLGSHAATAPASSDNSFIGGHSGLPTETFNGIIDEVRFWNTARTLTQIRSNMHLELVSSPSGLADYYGFCEGSGTSTLDQTGSKSATLVNFTFSGDGWVTSTAPVGVGTSADVPSFTSGTANLDSISITMTNAFDNAVDLVGTTIIASPSSLPTGVNAASVSGRYWVITPFGTPGSFGGNFTFNVDTLFTRNGLESAAGYTLYQRSDQSDGSWSAITSASSVTPMTITFNSVNNTSGQFVIGSTNPSLPVEASNFVATANVNSVTLSWGSQTEVNNAGFNILRRDAGSQSFTLIAGYATNLSLRGQGTSSTGKSYNFTDNSVVSGRTYDYKIQGASNDGTLKDLKTLTVSVGVPQDYAVYQNYPNPFNPSTTVRFDLKQTSTVTLEIFNILGQRVVQVNRGLLNAGRYDQTLNMSGFGSGVYFYKITALGSDGERFVGMKKFVLLK